VKLKSSGTSSSFYIGHKYMDIIKSLFYFIIAGLFEIFGGYVRVKMSQQWECSRYRLL